MRRILRPLEEPYRSRAIPAGTAHYLSWLFAARECRDALLAIYALLAEWRALKDPVTEPHVAQLKLAWWQEELERLQGGHPVHPISRFLAALPRAGVTDFQPLAYAVEASAAEIAGTPLERRAQLAAHSAALRAGPLRVAAELGGPPPAGPEAPLDESLEALAAGEYLASALAGYRREARIGRILLPVDELLAAGIENADLAAAEAPARLAAYLETLRRQAAQYFAAAAARLPSTRRAPQRHILVLAALGIKHLNSGRSASGSRLQDLYLAWTTARSASRTAFDARGRSNAAT